MARIVIVLSDPPLPFGNASARWFYVELKGLVRRGHQVTAFATCNDPDQASQAAELFPPPEFDLRLYPSRRGPRGLRSKMSTLFRPFSYSYGPEFRRDLKAELSRGVDVLQLEHLWGGWVGGGYEDRAVLTVHYLFEIDMAEVQSRGLEARARRWMTGRAERRLLRSYPTISTFTPRLTERVRELSPRSRVETVPLSMDLGLYPFEVEGPPAGDGPVLGLIGSFTWQPTLSSAVRLFERLWPEIRRRVPTARLQVVGRKAKSALAAYRETPGAAFFEDVPDTIPYFRSSDVLLYAPSRGSGMKVKVLEAFGLGVPVVTTGEGVEGIAAVDGVHAGICEDDAGLIDRTVSLLEDSALRERRRLAARALLEATVSPDVVLDRLEEVYRTLPSYRAAESSRRPSPVCP